MDIHLSNGEHVMCQFICCSFKSLINSDQIVAFFFFFDNGCQILLLVIANKIVIADLISYCPLLMKLLLFTN